MTGGLRLHRRLPARTGRPRNTRCAGDAHHRQVSCILMRLRLHFPVREDELEFARCPTRSTSSVPSVIASTAFHGRARRRSVQAPCRPQRHSRRRRFLGAVVWPVRRHGSCLRASCPGVRASIPLRQGQCRCGLPLRVRVRHPGNSCSVHVQERANRFEAGWHDGSDLTETLDCRGEQTVNDLC